MKSKEILNKNAKEILLKILKGESLTKIQEEYGVDKKTITEYYRNLFQEDKKALVMFDKVLENKKSKSSTKEIPNQELEDVILLYLSGKITLKEAGKLCGVSDQTFKKNMISYVQNDKKLLELYEKKKAQRADYSDLDFKEILLEMLEIKCHQKDLEEKYNLKPKTISKKISTFDNDENQDFYSACKMLSKSNEEKRNLTQAEEYFINKVIGKYKKDDEER